jgi:hypothetical protein
MKNKRGFEFSFGWIFSILIGASILFLAIYVTFRFVNIQGTVGSSETAQQLGTLLSPVETSIESASIVPINFTSETRLYNDCTESGSFGSQGIRIATKEGFNNKWQDAGIRNSYNNKYIFSESILEGKSVQAIAKSIILPYKIASLVILLDANKDYCFVSAPNDINDEIEEWGIKKINTTKSIGECTKNSIKVCFARTDCDVNVDDFNAKSVKKKNQTVYYEDMPDEYDKNILLFGAIFSDPKIYECQLKRIMKRASVLAEIYKQKGFLLNQKGCNTNLDSLLANYAKITGNVTKSSSIKEIVSNANTLESNNGATCKLF